MKLFISAILLVGLVSCRKPENAPPFTTIDQGKPGQVLSFNGSKLEWVEPPEIASLREFCKVNDLSFRIWCSESDEDKFWASAWPKGTAMCCTVEDGAKPRWVVHGDRTQTSAAKTLLKELHNPPNTIPKPAEQHKHRQCPPPIEG